MGVSGDFCLGRDRDTYAGGLCFSSVPLLLAIHTIGYPEGPLVDPARLWLFIWESEV